MEKFCFKVAGKDLGLRLDQYIIKNLKFPISRSRIQRLIKAGKIFVNQNPAKAHYKVKENDTLLINIPQPPQALVLPENIPLEIIFEDKERLSIMRG